MASKITFEDKEQIEQITDYPEKNQCTADNLNEIKNVVNTNADETNEQKESIEQNTTDITKLKEDNAKLKAQIPKGQASGEEITLSDSAEMELVEFGLQGNSKQETREGYNLANYNTKVDKNTPNFDIGDIKQQQVYTLYLYIPTGTISFNLKNKSNDSIILSDWNKTGKVLKTFTANQDDILHFNGFRSAGDYAGISEIMLLEGTYTTENIPTFEEYGASPSLNYPSEVEAVGDNGNVEIVTSNKNIFEETDNTKLFNTAYVELVKGNFFLEPNTNYRISFDTNNNGGKVYINEYAFGKCGEAICDGKRHSIISNSKFNTPKYLKTTAILKSSLDVEENYDISNIMLEKDTGVNTDFLEHKGKTYEIPTQRPLYKVKYNDDVIRDCFIYKDGKWYEQHNIGVFDLSKTTWNVGSVQVGTDIKTKRWGSNNKIGGFDFDKYTLSNYFNNNLHSGMFSTDSVGFNLESDRVYIRLPVEVAKTVEEVQAFWQEKAKTQLPIIVYRITQPVLLECTEEQTQILEQIIKDGTYKGITHFYCTDNLKPTIELTYYKDLETLFKNQESMQETLNNVQAQILELGG